MVPKQSQMTSFYVALPLGSHIMHRFLSVCPVTNSKKKAPNGAKVMYGNLLIKANALTTASLNVIFKLQGRPHTVLAIGAIHLLSHLNKQKFSNLEPNMSNHSST